MGVKYMIRHEKSEIVFFLDLLLLLLLVRRNFNVCSPRRCLVHICSVKNWNKKVP